jgi:hypothetical protein
MVAENENLAEYQSANHPCPIKKMCSKFRKIRAVGEETPKEKEKGKAT